MEAAAGLEETGKKAKKQLGLAGFAAGILCAQTRCRRLALGGEGGRANESLVKIPCKTTYLAKHEPDDSL